MPGWLQGICSKHTWAAGNNVWPVAYSFLMFLPATRCPTPGGKLWQRCWKTFKDRICISCGLSGNFRHRHQKCSQALIHGSSMQIDHACHGWCQHGPFASSTALSLRGLKMRNHGPIDGVCWDQGKANLQWKVSAPISSCTVRPVPSIRTINTTPSLSES